MPDLHSLAVFVLQVSTTWAQAISDPQQFLSPSFQPTDEQITRGLEFYFAMIAVSLLLYAPFVLGSHKSELGDKAGLAASAFVGLFSTALLAMSWHFAFWLLGGASTFSGTYLAYVYAGSPFTPLITFSSLIIFGALPPDLRRYAINPTTAQKGMVRAWADPRTNKILFLLGTLLGLVFIVWSLIVMFRCMSFVQNVGGLGLVGAIVLILLITAVVGYVLKAVQSVFNPTSDETLPPGSAADQSASISPEVVDATDSTQSAESGK
jgi:Yip1 domain